MNSDPGRSPQPDDGAAHEPAVDAGAARAHRGPSGALPRLVLLSAATGTLFGYAIAVSNDAIAFFTADLGLSSVQAAIVVSGLVAGALLGCLVAGPAADGIGRRITLIGAGGLAVLGTAVTAAAPAYPLLVGGRVLTGIAVGVTSAITPLYLAELSPARLRGAMLTSYQLFITIGILLALAVGLAMTPSAGWRWMFAVGIVPALLQVLGAVLVPPSPRHLVRRGEIDRARHALARMRPADEVDAELQTIVDTLRGAAEPSFAELKRRRYRPALVVGIAMALMNALVGVGAVIYYSTDVFRLAGVDGPTAPQIASLAVGGVNTIAAVASIGLTQRFGRRPLLTIGLTGIALSLIVAGAGLAFPAIAFNGALTVAAVLAFMAFFAISAGPLAWLLVSEVFPVSIRARAAAAATAANWAANLMITLLFPIFAGSPGVPARVGAAFWFFAVMSLGFLVFVRLRVPETKGRTLEDIETHLQAPSR